MANEQIPQGHEDDAMKNNIRGKFEKMFSDQEPLRHNSVRKAEANLNQEEASDALAEREKPQNSVHTIPSKSSAHNEADFSNSRRWFAKFWSWLTEPHSSIT